MTTPLYALLGHGNGHPPTPIILSVTPNEGGEFLANIISIAGSGFVQVLEVNLVGSDGTVYPCTSVNVVANQPITAATPINAAAGTYSVQVKTAGGTATLSQAYIERGHPHITSIVPSAGPLAGGTFITIHGSNFLGAHGTRVGIQELPEFTVVDDNTITGVVPPGVEGPDDVTVYNVVFSGVRVKGYRYELAPVIQSIIPNAGPLAGGQGVTVSGQNFEWVTGVTIGGLPLNNFQNDGGEIQKPGFVTGETPANIKGVFDVVATSPGGSSTLVQAYSYFPPPVLISSTPSRGPAAGGTVITVTGTELISMISLFVGSQQATVQSITDTVIIATVPASTPGTFAVRVVTAGGSDSIAGAFMYGDPPTFASLSPSRGPAGGGQDVGINGTGFVFTTGVYFDGVLASVKNINDDTSIVVTTGLHTPVADPTDVNVRIVTDFGEVVTTTSPYTIVPVPRIDSVTPDIGPSNGGTDFVISGQYFTGAVGSAVTVGGISSSFILVDDATITATTPVGTVGPADVVVRALGGAATLIDGFTYYPAPTITSIYPVRGSISGGNAVVLTGTGFSGALSVHFGSVTATSFIVDSDTQITAIAPAESQGGVDMKVVTPGGTTDPGSVTYTFMKPPTVLTVNPSGGPVAGGTSVIIGGSDLQYATSITFGGVSIPSNEFVVLGSNSIQMVSPEHGLGSVDVSVVTEYGQGTGYNVYDYVSPPTVTSIVPNSGPQSGGTAFIINGTDFTGGSVTIVGGGIITGSLVVVDDTQMTAVTDSALVAGVKTVNVTGRGGSISIPDGFTYIETPELISVEPPRDAISGGRTVTITGTALSNATSVKFGAQEASVLFNSDTEIVVTVPAQVTSGNVTIIVRNPGGISNGIQFLYGTTPTITDVSPVRGPLAGGTSVTISGTDLLYTTSVTFNGNTGTITSTSNGSIVVTTPPGLQGTWDVVVTTDYGTVTDTSAFRYQPDPIINSVTPEFTVRQSVSGQISGQYFSGVTAVEVGGNPASYAFVDDGTITFTQISINLADGDNAVTVTTEIGSTTYYPGVHVYIGPTTTSSDAKAAPLAGQRVITIYGTDLAIVNFILFCGVPAVSGSLIVISNTQIQVTCDAIGTGNPQGSIQVSSPLGTANNLPFRYDDGPTITSISPTAAPRAGGADITATGSGYTNVHKVSGTVFGPTITTVLVGSANAVISQSVTDFSSTTFKFKAPALPPGTYDVVITSENGVSATLSQAYTAVAIPTITSISPNTGSANGGQQIVINGTNLSLATAYTVGGATLTDVSIDSNGNFITGTPRAHPSGSVDVVVTTPGGVATELSGYTYIAPPNPTISSISPSSGPTNGGRTVTIYGTFLDNPQSVTFSGISATEIVTAPDGNSIVCKTPPSQTVNVAAVVVTTYGGSASGSYTYTTPALATVTSITPNYGPTGTTPTNVVILGSDFTDVSSITNGTYSMAYDTIPGFTIVNDGEITSPFRNMASGGNTSGTGPQNVRVTTPGGATIVTRGFVFVDSPTLLSYSPKDSFIAGGSTLTITSGPFYAEDVSGGTVTVKVGTVFATGVTRVSDTVITCTVPAQAATGPYSLVVKTTGGSQSVTTTFSSAVLFYDDVPTLTGLSKSSGKASDTITVQGLNHYQSSRSIVSGVTVGSATATVNSSSTAGTSITLPTNTVGTYDIVVTFIPIDPNTGSAYTLTLSQAFTYVPAPTFTSASPATGSTAGAQNITINGTNLLNATAITFGGTGGTVVSVDPSGNSLVATIPAHASGAVNIIITTPGGTVTTTTSPFTYFTPHTVSTVSPSSALNTSAQTIPLTGTNFQTTGMTVSFVLRTSPFTSTPLTTTYVSATSMTVTVPSGFAVGGYDVVVGGPSKTTVTKSNAYQSSAVIPTFDPATLPLTGWFRNYAGLPNAGSGSAGSSSGKSLTLATGSTPSVGSLSGKGVSTWTAGTCLTTSTGERQMFGTTTGGGFVACLIKATYTPVSTVGAGQGYNGSGIWSDNTGYGANVYMGMSMTTSQILAYLYKGSSYADVRVTLGTGSTTNVWLALFMWWDGTNLYLQVNNGSPASISCPTFSFVVNNNVQIGRSYTSAANDFAGQGAEYMFADSNLGATSSNITNIYSYFKATYPAAGLP